jgi:1-deoxy-D-xylulose 5-phosphate reductoisomerase
VAAFLQKKISFTDIFGVIEKSMNISGSLNVVSIENIIEADKNGRAKAQEIVDEICG